MRLIDADALIKELEKSHKAHGQNSREESLFRRDLVIIMEQPTAYEVEKVVDYTHDIICNILEKVLEPLPDGSEYTEEAYRLLYLNTRLRGLIRNGGKE